MAHRDGLDLVAAFVQGFDEADKSVAAQAEGARDLLSNQIVDDHLAAVERVSDGHNGPSCVSGVYLILACWLPGEDTPDRFQRLGWARSHCGG